MQIRLWRSIRKHLNFYRIHILTFTFTPLIFSAIFYASNGQTHISYVDSLFLSVSAMTVCGLATVDLSSLTPWQQVILFIQMCLGSPVVVSWVTVYLRKHYFEKKFEHVIQASLSQAIDEEQIGFSRTFTNLFRRREKSNPPSDDDAEERSEKEKKTGLKKLRTDMIRRVDDAPKLVNPSGWISEGDRIQMKRTSTIRSNADPNRHLSFAEPSPEQNSSQVVIVPARSRRLSDPGTPSRPSTPPNTAVPMHRFDTVGPSSRATFGRTQTVEFSTSLPRRRTRRDTLQASDGSAIEVEDRRSTHRMSSATRPPLAVHLTTHTSHTHNTYKSARRAKHSGFGGFPMPHEIVHSIFKRFFPGVRRELSRTATIPRTTTIVSQHGDTIPPPGVKVVPYITFDAVVGRNSVFPELTDEQIEELGGVEYRALNALLWIVAGYHIGVQLLAFVVIAPYISTNRWSQDFVPPALHRAIATPWFALFQVISAYTNTGMSLVDTSMVPFQQAYPMIVFMVLLIVAGNTGFPVFLRFTIWLLSKVVPRTSRAHETLHFLLDHPRRCFIYLFPSHQTWFLLTVVFMLNVTDWFFFMVLDIGNPALDVIPLGTRFAIGLLQACAVRAAGFGTVALSALAPAVKVLYVVMMYVSVYPIAMSVRSTNVYEEQSLGVFRDDDEDEDNFEATGSRVTVWSRYLALHARKQLSFDMWWLGLALFLVCIIERHNLDDESTAVWFNIFTIIFELVSAYGTVGLSLGLPIANYSFAGALRPLSKLIICVVMIRGRHRGLPVAIDRAVMLPMEFERHDESEEFLPSYARQPSTDEITNGNAHNGNTISEKTSSVDDGRINGHHRLSVTEERPDGLSQE
ncbi:hypothetical protein K435DRAFT_773402 [Dendrothele bispora CBS 962.96]|uniref:Potassium transport protein n=1 Tax=Dendrothele bispora (strain CBS 962.96) TaxID=1314807 RepID=A0A4V6T5Q3_DENBC|nr:hypothetical protein K435DRAFT_773402 [Dendrothele bispora CBS 962.96]